MKIESMAADLLGGAALGAVFGKLLEAILDAKDRAVSFKSVLDRLESTIKTISPIINETQELKKKLDRPKEELDNLIEHLNKGRDLVRKCSKFSRWNSWKKPSYTKKLEELDDYIIRFFNINIQAQQSRDTQQILVEVKGMGEKIGSGFKNPIGLLLDSCGVPEAPSFTVGLDVPLKELKMWVFKNGAPVLVLSAPGGCGKTTLAKKLCQDDEVRGKFKNIFFVTVSKTPNLNVIIQKLIRHKGYRVPEFQTDEDAINQLEELLKQIRADPVLLVLDDVWSGSESLIDKFVLQIPDYKILVTSRSVFPRFRSTYNLKLLNDEDAMTLFCRSALPQNGSSYMPDEDLVNKIVRNCNGFPLALTVVGRSLCEQPAAVWQSRVMEWCEGQSIFNSEIDLLNCLKTSLDVLDNNIKECFMDLGSFPEDQRIPASALVDMWVELYKLDEHGVYAMANLHELSTRNLVNPVVTSPFTRKDASEVDGYYNEYFVMLHDLLRELAVYQSNQGPVEQRKKLLIDMSRNNLPKWFMEPIWQPISARLLSISTDEMFSSSWPDMQLPEVEVIVLNFQAKSYTLPMFMKKMDKLKVLIVSNYGFCPAELSNFPLLASLCNLKRIRLEHISIPSLSNIKLKNLRKASFKMCKNIGQAFRNSTIQLPDMWPNLVEIDIDYCNDLVELPASLCDIVHLKKLSITNCHELSKLPERIGNLANLEVLRLHACTELSELPSSIGSLHKLSFLDISDCLRLWRLPEEMGELCNLRKLHMTGCSSLSELPPSIMDLRHLKYVFCDEETSSLWEPFESHLTNLNIQVTKENLNLNWLHNLQF